MKKKNKENKENKEIEFYISAKRNFCFCKYCTFYELRNTINNIKIPICTNPFGLHLAGDYDFCSRGVEK